MILYDFQIKIISVKKIYLVDFLKSKKYGLNENIAIDNCKYFLQ